MKIAKAGVVFIILSDNFIISVDIRRNFMEAIIAFIVIVGILGGLDWAALKFGVNSRVPELLKEKHV